MAKMTVCHGGYMPVERPEIRISRNTKDFGPGFYCTDCYLSVEMMRQMSLPNIIPGQLTNSQKK